jgi:activating signal cointegrator complex subunit 3
MATMNKPTYAAIMTYSPKHPVLVFVSSRRQTRLTALDLMSLSAADGAPRKFLASDIDEKQLEEIIRQVKGN